MPGDNPTIDKTVEDIKTGMGEHNLTTVFDDLKQAQTSGDFEKFKQELNKSMHEKGVLPGLDIEGVKDGKLVLKDTKSGAVKLVDQNTNLTEVKGTVIENRAGAEKQPDKGPGDAAVNRNGDGAETRVTRTGDVQRTQGDATRPPAEPGVERDKDGRLQKLEYAPGQTREFKYDKEGKPSEIKDSNGTTFSTKDGGKTWNMHDKSGDHAVSGLIIDRRGDIVYQDDKKNTTVLRHDGSTVEANEKGQVTKIHCANGKDLEFGYNKDTGVLEHVKNQWGDWSSKDGKTFTEKTSGETWKGTVSVDKSGTYQFVSETGEAHILRPNGSTTIMDKGKVTEIEDAKGQKFTFKYDAMDGHLSEVTNEHGHWSSKDGHEFTRDDGTKWSGRVAATADGTYGWISDAGHRVIHQPNGNKIEDDMRRADAEVPQGQGRRPEGAGDGRGGDRQRPPEGQRPVDENLRDGSRVHHNKDGSAYRVFRDGTIVTDMVDGSRIKEYPNGGRVEMNPRGQVTFADDGRGHSREFRYDQNGQLAEIRGMDGSTWHRARPGLWVDDRGRGFQGEVLGVDKNGTAHYQPEGGRPFVHTIDGRVMPETGDSRDRHPGTRNRDQERGGGDGRQQGGRQPGGDQGAQPGGDQRRQQPGGDQGRQQPQPGGDQSRQQPPTGDQTPPKPDRPPEAPPKTPETRAEAQKPAEPTKLEKYKAHDGTYNPLQPPGLDMQPGEQSEKHVDTGKDNIGLDWRKLTEKKENDDGSISYKYEGELDDCGWMPWNWGDTNFSANEKYSKEGQLLERNMHYDSAKDLKFDTASGPQELKGVTDVNTTYNKEKGVYETTIVTKDHRYKAEVGADGKVTKFEKVTDDKQDDTVGDKSANVGAFSPEKGQYNPVRPQGIGEVAPGAGSGDDGKGLDHRTSQAENLPDGGTLYRYKGELEDSGVMPWNWGDTNFEGEEKIDKDGNVVETHVRYDSAVDQQYVGPNGQKISIDNVKSVDTTRQGDGTYISQVKDKNGNSYFFVTDAKGKVKKYVKVQQ